MDLGAIRCEDFNIKEAQGGLPGMDFFNVRRDPGKKYGKLYPGLFAVAPMQMLLGQHMGRIGEFPHRPPMTAQESTLTAHD